MFLKKKHLSSDSLKITSSVFPDFQKCFLNLPNTLFSYQKHLKVFLSVETLLKITAKRALNTACLLSFYTLSFFLKKKNACIKENINNG